jgi:predicted nucleic acid-binding protein
MTGLAFFDTNILVYADDDNSPSKQALAIPLVAEHRREESLVVSLQVLQEYFAVTTRKLKVDPAIAQTKVEILATRQGSPLHRTRCARLHRTPPPAPVLILGCDDRARRPQSQRGRTLQRRSGPRFLHSGG